jgi:hypothetical protein
MEVGRSLRSARAAVFAAACVGVSAAGHLWMSGPSMSIPAWVLCVAVLAVTGTGYALAGRWRGFASIGALMLVGQLGLHLLFTVAQHAAGGAVSSMPGVPDTSRMIVNHPVRASAWLCGGAMGTGGVSAGHGVMPPMAWMSAYDSAGMIAVHAGAGLLCAWWLYRGEAAAFRLLHVLAQFALPLLMVAWPGALAVTDAVAAVRVDANQLTASDRRLLVHALVRRGPPTPVLCM